MELLNSLESSAFGMWIVTSDTVWAYPTILMLHTLGLGMVVGTNAILDFRLLGFAERVPLSELRKLYRPMWIGFIINMSSGVCLFIANATRFGVMLDFYLKLTLITLALIVAVRIKQIGIFSTSGESLAIPPRAKFLASLSLALWAGAIIAGRAMAYIR